MARKREQTHQLDRITTDRDRTYFIAYCTCGTHMMRHNEFDAVAAIERHISNAALRP